MVINEQFLNEYFKDPQNLFLIWGEKDRLIMDEDYFPLDYLSLFVPLTGSIDFKTNLHVLHAEPSHIQFFTHDEAIRVTDISDDYTSVGLIFSKKYWNHTLLHSHPYLTMSVVHPCLEVTAEQRETLLKFYRVIVQLKQAGVADNDPVIINLILGILFYIGRFYEKWSNSFPKQSDNKVVAKFTSLLYQNYREHRDVEFYAKKLNLSKSRFSEIVKGSTAMSPHTCIERYTILKICSILKNTETPVKEIAYDLNFTDTSHFCKFFKKHIGQSPLEFRNDDLIKYPTLIDE